MKKIVITTILATVGFALSITAQSPITVTETNFKLPILGEEVFYFGFAKGDQLLFSFAEENAKDLKEVEIIEYPSTSRFKELKTSSIQNKRIIVPRTGIYQFRFANTVMLQKSCQLKIERIAASSATANFNSTVYWRTVYDTTYRTLQQHSTAQDKYKTTSLVAPGTYYLDANTSAGKPQIILPVTLPDFTSEWYYVYAAANTKEKAEALKSSFQLAATLQKRINETGGVSFSADSLPAPVGTDTCRIYLLDESNQQVFESRGPFRHFKEGTRENATAGLVKIKTATFPNAFLGIRNPNLHSGIFVAIEAVAIIAPDDTQFTAETQSVSIKARKEPYLKN